MEENDATIFFDGHRAQELKIDDVFNFEIITLTYLVSLSIFSRLPLNLFQKRHKKAERNCHRQKPRRAPMTHGLLPASTNKNHHRF